MSYESILNDKNSILLELQKLKENVLSKKILVPLFEKIYCSRVEFVGGVREKGRDIIVYSRDPLGDPAFIAIQVKKLEVNSNTSGSAGMQQLLNQLSQALYEEIVCPDSGIKVRCSKIIFATPYNVNQIELDTHFGSLNALKEKGVKVVDGGKITELIIKHQPSLISELFDNSSLAKRVFNSNLNNSVLMSALNSNNIKKIENLYCDVSFLPGSRGLDKYLQHEIFPKSENFCEIKVSGSEIEYFNEVLTYLKIKYNLSPVSTEGLKKFEKCLKIIESEKNIIKSKQYEMKSIVESFINIVSKNSYVYSNLKGNSNHLYYEDLIENAEPQLTYILDKSVREKFKSEQLDEIKFTINNSIPLVREIKKLNFELKKHNREKNKAALNIEVDIQSLFKDFNNRKCDLVNKYNNREINEISFIDEIENLVKYAKKLKIFENYLTVSKNNTYNVAIKLNCLIRDIFDSGRNFILLGEAGSGKTTNLQVYAKYLYNKNLENRLVIYSTLNDIAEKCSVNEKGLPDEFINGICVHLNSLGLKINYNELKKHFESGDVTLVLDSIDEAVGRFPSIIHHLVEIKNSYKSVQIITSSRNTVNKIFDIPFVQIKLMPFNHDQKSKFFYNWFSENKRTACKIMDHLKNLPDLDAVVSNPLSATILCVLQENSVPLPETESSLYKNRFELMSGEFDQFKGIKRLKNSSKIIIGVLKNFAFWVHKKRRKSFSKDDFYSNFNDFKLKGANVDGETLFDDFIKSEIILIKSNGKFDFGHFKFQEYLVSEAIEIRQREISIDKTISDSWWNQVFILYAQHAQSIDWIIDLCIRDALVADNLKLLHMMAELRPQDERNKLMSKLIIAQDNEVDDLDYSGYFGENKEDEELKADKWARSVQIKGW